MGKKKIQATPTKQDLSTEAHRGSFLKFLTSTPVSNFLYGSQAHLTPELDKLFILRVIN